MTKMEDTDMVWSCFWSSVILDVFTPTVNATKVVLYLMFYSLTVKEFLIKLECLLLLVHRLLHVSGVHTHFRLTACRSNVYFLHVL